MRLLIVESPAKAKTIQTYLGSDWQVAASMGHIRDLPSGRIGVSSPDYRLEYVVTKPDQVAKLVSLARHADEVFLATDPDREGEAISWHLMEVLRLRSPKRVTFNAITEQTVKAAVSAPRTIDEALVSAQEARRALDRLVGFEVSPLLSRLLATKASAGRVQSPAVRLVVEREEAIERFTQTKHFGARVVFDGGKWTAEWDTKPWLGNDEQYLLDVGRAEKAAGCRDFKVITSETKIVPRQPPAAFTTSELQQAAFRRFRFDVDVTMQLAQKLYEAGHISYHRTDNPNLDPEAIAAIRELAGERGWPVPASPRKWASKESAQEAHPAIHPTHLERAVVGDDDKQQKLYQLIWQQAVASQLAAAEYFATNVELECQQGEDRYRFGATGRVLQKPGWLVLQAKEGENDDEVKPDSNGAVPALPKGSSKRADSGEVLAKATTPPTRYTQATLIKALEAAGVGRPATYASIMRTIMKDRNFVEEKGKAKHLFPTAIGRAVVQALRGKYSFVDLDFTRRAEDELDDIASGKAQYREVISGMHQKLRAEIGVQMKDMGFDPNGPLPPSDKAVTYARSIAQALGIDLPDDTARSTAALRTWIDANKKAYDAAHEAAFAARMAGEPASEKQISVIQRAIDEGKVPAPEGWPAISKLSASKLLDQIMGGSSDRKASDTRKSTTGGRRSSRRGEGTSASDGAPRYASDKQMDLLRRLVGDKKIRPPAGWPDKVLMVDASSALDKAFGKRASK
ncbi:MULTISPECIES: type I DNA topoisomerase [unclassified Xanthobacter]|uniref:type I DNA topoisomerase n=1 Tax=unclassified Xanthobacter TaxID=2623496 RepID=UPI001F01DACF|nr:MULTISPECIES: type I DNA topoisomerase [unclassified Xanthobacter]